jgi:hypothetical protein
MKWQIGNRCMNEPGWAQVISDGPGQKNQAYSHLYAQ